MHTHTYIHTQTHTHRHTDTHTSEANKNKQPYIRFEAVQAAVNVSLAEDTAHVVHHLATDVTLNQVAVNSTSWPERALVAHAFVQSSAGCWRMVCAGTSGSVGVGGGVGGVGGAETKRVQAGVDMLLPLTGALVDSKRSRARRARGCSCA